MSAAHVDRLRMWVDALRSGRYAQAIGALRKLDGYCCLGVACDVYRDNTGTGEWDDDEDTGTLNFMVMGSGVMHGEDTELPEPVAAWFLADTFMIDPYVDVPADPDVTDPDDPAYRKTPQQLSTLNDGGMTFTEIADLIERQLIPYAAPLEDVDEVPAP